MFLIFGLVLLVKGADWLVSGASSLAKRHHMSDLAIGLTIVAFGTSAPEMVVNVIASWQGHQEIVFGNVIGSNNFNLFFILGITGLIRPIVVQSSTVWKEIPISLLAAILLFVFTNDFFRADSVFILNRLEGIILLLCFGFFLFYVYRQLKTDPAVTRMEFKDYSNLKIWSLITIGLAGLVIGGRLVVINAVEMATTLGVSEKIIGLTIIAAGTSLPELATSLVAALKGKNDIAVGNIIGSNIFNIFLILSVSALVRPVPYELVFNMDIFMLIVGTLFLFAAMFTSKKEKLDRWEAGVLLFSFVFYTVWLVGKEI